MLITYFIIGITVLISWYAFNDRELFYKLSFSPYQVKHHNEWYRSLTHAFVHADIVHIMLNMYVLYIFGVKVENALFDYYGLTGKINFCILYIGGILFSTIISFARHQNNERYVSVGASGAVAALIFAGIIIDPQMKLLLILIPIPIPGFIFALLYLVAEFLLDKYSKNNIAHDAHFAGAIFGILFIVLFDYKLFLNFIKYLQYYFS